MNAKEMLAKVFAQASIEEVPFNNNWNNGTGYFDDAVRGKHALHLEPGKMVKSITPGGRKIVMVGTNIGNVVVFDRYPTTDNSVIVYNMPRQIRVMSQIEHTLSTDDIAHLLGVSHIGDDILSYGHTNIGKMVDSLMCANNPELETA